MLFLLYNCTAFWSQCNLGAHAKTPTPIAAQTPVSSLCPLHLYLYLWVTVCVVSSTAWQ